MQHRPCHIVAAILAAVSAVSIGPARADAPPSPNRVELPPTSSQVEAAMKKAVDFLLSKKKSDNFESGIKWTGINLGGETAIATYALLHAGRSLDDARLDPNSDQLKPVITYLEKLDVKATYTAGLTASALSFLPPNTDNRRMFKSTEEYLIDAINRDAAATGKKNDGGYTYTLYPTGVDKATTGQQKLADLEQQQAQAVHDKDKATYDELQKKIAALKKEIIADSKKPAQLYLYAGTDASNSQYGVLGLWAMADFGVEVPTDMWTLLDGYWRRNQLADGGWTYNPIDKKGATKTMSIAGLASLYITQEYLDDEVRLDPHPDPAVDRGLEHVIKDFSEWTAAKAGDGRLDFLYYMYGVERVGLASGFKFFDTHNWYREGADAVMAKQNASGGWTDRGSTVVGTSYGLLFLARGRNAVPFNKLQYDGPWNARPRDDANIVEWMGKKYEKELNWQVVNTKVEPEEWLDSPILHITGSQELKFTPEELAKIKKYIEMGGMVFTTCDGGSGPFDKSVRAIIKQMFPKYEPHTLKRDNMLFNGDLHTDPIKNPPPVLALSNGSRFLWIHTTDDMGASWQKRAYSKTEDYLFPLNLYFYSVGLDTHRTKLDDIVIHVGKAAMKDQASVATLDLGPNPEPEPFAWQRMTQIARADMLTDLSVKLTAPADLPAAKPTLAAFTGTAAFKATPDEIAGVQKYLAAGGTLLADSTAGNPAFTTAFLDFAKQLYPTATLENIPADDPFFTGKIPGSVEIKDVDFRKFTRFKTHAHTNEMRSPLLRGIKANGRWVVLFSEYDLTSGLLGTETWGINGYAPDSAVDIVRNAITYAKNPPH